MDAKKKKNLRLQPFLIPSMKESDQRRDKRNYFNPYIVVSPMIIVAAALSFTGGSGSNQAAQLAALLRCSVLCKHKQLLYQHARLPWRPRDKATYIRFVVLQQVTYCCASLSAGLEKPFKQDNLSVSLHGGTQTKH